MTGIAARPYEKIHSASDLVTRPALNSLWELGMSVKDTKDTNHDKRRTGIDQVTSTMDSERGNASNDYIDSDKNKVE